MDTNVTLFCKPEQSGKTYIMIQLINKMLSNPIGPETINIIFCDNNLLLTKQTTIRVARDVISDDDFDNYVEFSSSKNGNNVKTIEAVLGKIAFSNVRNITCCTNTQRMEDILKIVNIINSKTSQFNFNIWLDEADRFVKYINTKLLPLVHEHSNVWVNLLTATPSKLFDKYDFMRVFPIENTTSENYHGWTDNIVEIRVNELGSIEGFISQIINDFIKNNGGIPEATNWYIPAGYKKQSHYLVRDLLNSKGFVVFVVNGDGLELSLPFGEKFKFAKSKELHQQARELIVEKHLESFPIAFTGDRCISRGISMMAKENNSLALAEFIFDYAIFSNVSDHSEVSQKAGRIKGNIKDWVSYKQPVVFCTERFHQIATHQEKLSRDLAKLAYSYNTTKPSIITSDDFNGLSTYNPNRKRNKKGYTVPILVNITPDEFQQIISNKPYNLQLIHSIISKYKPSINFSGWEKDQISAPKSYSNSYSKNIQTLLNAIQNNTKYCQAIKRAKKHKKVYQIWLDNVNKNIIISFYNGKENSVNVNNN